MSMNAPQRKSIIAWLSLVVFLVFTMVIVGGVTRLTHSGLSIVEWKPIMGTLPPLNEESWNQAFEKYKEYPEYQTYNRNMDLSEFKYIFYWEYFHRLIGRLIGVVYLIPYLFFYFKGYFDKQLNIKLLIGFILGALQGIMGWVMVKSGLVDNPHVSHYRLAAHLCLAFAIAAYLFWIILQLYFEKHGKSRPHRRFGISILVTAGIVLQIIYGAFTAGKKAGFGYNTFPKMEDKWIADEVFSIEPAWLNFFETNAAIQFTHRIIAWLLLFGISAFIILIRKELGNRQKIAMHFLTVSLGIQFCLGVLTILFIGDYEVFLPSIHQAGAFILFMAAIFFNYTLHDNR